MALGLTVTSLTFSDRSTIELDRGSVMVVVGPNNAGKSAALREILETVTSHRHPQAPPPAVVTDVQVAKAGDEADLVAWLDQNAFANPAVGLLEPQFSRSGAGATNLSQLKAHWQSGPPFQALTPFLVVHAGGEQRLGLTNSQGVQDLSSQPPTTPLQVLHQDEAREAELAAAVRQAFGTSVVVNRVAGAQIHLHLGELPRDAGLPVVTNVAYRAAINALPRVHAQGDGI